MYKYHAVGTLCQVFLVIYILRLVQFGQSVQLFRLLSDGLDPFRRSFPLPHRFVVVGSRARWRLVPRWRHLLFPLCQPVGGNVLKKSGRIDVEARSKRSSRCRISRYSE